MLLQTLYNRIGKQPLNIVNSKQVKIIIEEQEYPMSKLKYDGNGANEMLGMEIIAPPIYVITVFDRIEEIETSSDKKDNISDIGLFRIRGFYYNKEWALNALHCNMSDLWEHKYDYAVLETYQSGICACGVDRQEFFKYSQELGGYYEIKTPKILKNNGGFVFG